MRSRLITAFRSHRPSSASRSSAFDSCSMTGRKSRNRRVPNHSRMAVTTRTHYGDHNRRRNPGNNHRKTNVDERRAVFDCRNNSARNRSARTCAAYSANCTLDYKAN